MSNHDQCPTSRKEGKPVHQTPVGARALQVASTAASGKAYWRGLEEVADTPEFRDWLEREFPAGASELDAGGQNRRTFLKLMGASLALAGAATIPACRRPEHPILPYSAKVPEDVIPGKALFYATSMPLPGGGGEGLLIETHGARPTKVEGNPLHPVNQGKSTLWSQASILALYDPDRLKQPEIVRPGSTAGKAATWDDFAAWCKQNTSQFDTTKGAGLAFVVDKKSSPTRDAIKAEVLTRWPQAKWVAYDALEDTQQFAGLQAAFGQPVREVLDLSKAKVILSLGRDFMQFESLALKQARDFAAARKVLKAADAMNRLYVVESTFSNTGASADHRLKATPTQTAALLVALAEKLALPGSLAAGLSAVKAKAGTSPAPAGWVEALADDLTSAKGNAVVIVGPSQPAWVHALAAAINAHLGALGNTVRYAPLAGDGAIDSTKALADLVKSMDAGTVKTVVCSEVNPCFNVPGFEAAFLKVPQRITLSVEDTETVQASTWRLNGTTYLEQWGDIVAGDGTISPIQPMIAPLYAGKSEVEALAIIAGLKVTDGYELTRNTWRATIKAPTAGDFEKAWRRALYDGLLAGTGSKPPASATLSTPRVAESLVGVPAQNPGEYELVFLPGAMGDGRWMNNAWLQELPDPAGRTVWDNPAMISPATAKKLGINPQDYTTKKPDNDVIEIKLGTQTLRIVAWVVPGIADDAVILPLGYGRRVCGLVGSGVGFDTFAIKPHGTFAARAEGVARTGELYQVSSTQLHGSMEGRAIIREIDSAAWAKFGDDPIKVQKDSYGREMKLTLGERVEGSEMAHMPALVGAYVHPYNGSKLDVDPTAAGFHNPKYAAEATRPQPAFAESPQWGMSIDLSACIGCNVCTIACQSENNIPSVGKIEVNRGREMHWIRVDRYFTGDDRNDPSGMLYQPVACVHCENAPCEVVCPVNATVHGPEGHNYMVYNRCIGTRYCANNCPYKVRRFNFFDYGVTKFNGGLTDGISDVTPAVIENHLPANQNLIPPRLRKKLDEITRLEKNPNVTVRSRGVMEKCTYCIQRTNEAKIELKLKGLRKNSEGVPDMYVQTACQQACPTGAITFGDILDTTSHAGKGSIVRQMREHTRTYALLGYLAVRPRTTYMVRVNNPNPKIRPNNDNPFGTHGEHQGGGHQGGGEGGGEGGKPAGHTFFDRSKLYAEDGYKLSLSVLGGKA